VKRVIATLRLARTEEGGRRTPIAGSTYACPVFFDGVPQLASHAYDCRILLPEGVPTIAPGDTIAEIPLLFLSPDQVFPHLRLGVTFTLWEGKTIGRGVVVRIEEESGGA
jgi:hypothetical protein